jgi:hypothetical protein
MDGQVCFKFAIRHKQSGHFLGQANELVKLNKAILYDEAMPIHPRYTEHLELVQFIISECKVVDNIPLLEHKPVSANV